MTELDSGSFENHKSCTVGDTVIATTEEGKTVTGVVVAVKGSTVFAQSDSGGMLEFRRVNDSNTGETGILLGIDGKEVSDEEIKEGVNPDGIPITSESFTLSFDHVVVDFESETQEVYLGDDER